MDCLILAGNRRHYRKVSNKENKAFLEIEGCTLIQILLRELAKVAEINRVFLVGPKRALELELDRIYPSGYSKPLTVFEQTEDLVSNILEVAEVVDPDGLKNLPILVLPSDIPLILAEEIREFISLCDMERFDYVGGLVTATSLAKFFPKNGRAGIEMALFLCEDEGYRISNLHMVRPFKVRRAENIRRTYAFRYQKRFINAIGVFLTLVGMVLKDPGAMIFYLGMRMAATSQRSGFKSVARLLRPRLTLSRLAYHIGRVLGTRFNLVVTSLGGCAVDVDNEADYQVIRVRFQEWIALQKELAQSSRQS